jgi:multidrug efflux pump subunit AcrA (membrane-fusion protein)
MNHLTEGQLILHYYEEAEAGPEPELHLKECADCRAAYAALQRTLNAADAMAVPERGADYGAEVWRRIESRIGARRAWRWQWTRALAYAALVLALVGAGFLAGRLYPERQKPPVVAEAPSADGVLRVAVGQYLDRSQMVLSELANADPRGSLDITMEQERAQALIEETRIYRQSARRNGEDAVAALLEEIERVLLEIARGPSTLAPEDVEALRERLDSEEILFKIRVVSSNVRSRL